MYIQHLEVRYPNHNGHPDQTIEDHTWAPRVALLEHDQSFLYYQVFQLKGTIHHEDKRFLTRPKKQLWTHNAITSTN